ncbi:TPA: DUF2586 family protein [Citrobacter farmeri]|uniref:Phage tail protein n=1 Tax=Citrobacter farmeri TaxID=67824 RepID=A0ACA8D3M0_9ENTR|nr:DUF2586 domain-containing protein [Citrobacter farmeri]AST78809.1 phage tail protein [Citrobacter farmeri]HAT2749604.1 DUF2586 family protein [Citrobacter farmeri]HBI2992294.1 DUF2586 family protein [Citrobacter farmeri]HBI2997359.1 DUF2586 family protein [Citrobacter farmeri]HBI3003079.1 DUF2586 family protein [Citrobacter farmeri]
MTWPNVNVSQLNRFNGTTKDVERVVLFVGYGKTNTGKTQPLNTDSDLDKALGDDDSLLKAIVSAAANNAGQNWFAYVHVLSEPDTEAEGYTPDEDWMNAVKQAQSVASTEGILLAFDTANKATINRATEMRTTLQANFGRFVWFALAVGGPNEGEAWADYVLRVTELQKGIASPGVQLVPRLWGNEPGVLVGRLCNRSVTIADSPARVATGALTALGSDTLPVDGTGAEIDLSVLQSLEVSRFSVPMWYHDFDGIYWSDGRTLDVEGGDYQTIENVRIVDKASRRVRLRAIPKIADRSLNSTPGSIAAHQTYFGKPLREMAIATEINGVPFPGEVKPPKDGDITIAWASSTKVQIFIVVRPYESAKEIGVSIELDTSLES